MRRAPVVLLAYASPDAYVARYAEPDKTGSGLGDGTEDWPVPYWFGDAAFGVMAVLLGAVDAGLGASFLGNFRGEDGLGARLGVPGPWRLFGAVLLGRPDGKAHRSASLRRERRRAGNGSIGAAGEATAALGGIEDLRRRAAVRRGSTGASRPVEPASWYSSSTLTDQMSWEAPNMFSTVSMAVYMEWSWLLYLCMPLRPTGWMLGALASSQLRMVATFSL